MSEQFQKLLFQSSIEIKHKWRVIKEHIISLKLEVNQCLENISTKSDLNTDKIITVNIVQFIIYSKPEVG